MSVNYRGPSRWALVASAAAALGERSRYLEHMDTADIAMGHEVVVIGAGFSGIGAAIKLDQAGFRDTPVEFRDTLHMLAEGKVNPGPLVTGTVGLDGVDGAFEALGDPKTHAKILVDPKSTAVAP